MGFASTWLNQRALFPEIIKESPDDQTGIIVVIPSFDESSITVLLDSLNSCTEPECKTEVLIILNAPTNASVESIRNNRKCFKDIEDWKKQNNCFFRLLVFDAGQPQIKGWGVGLARKTGMDEAIRRFNFLGKPDGVIVCLDADCTVEKNYFESICDEFYKRKERSACSIYFEHELSGSEFQDRVYSLIMQYELHLRYFIQGLKYAGYPHPFHTVGSAIAVRANQYIKSGGMNRKQAGEDFYFVQKLIPLGGYFSLNTTTVFPSPRESHRVPFGTGVIISKLIGTMEEQLLTYNTLAFQELKDLFSAVPQICCTGKTGKKEIYENLPPGIKAFIEADEWYYKTDEITGNTSTPESFRKRFFSWFNAFMVVKYMNYVHKDFFSKKPVIESAYNFAGITGSKLSSSDPLSVLHYYRFLDRGFNK